MMTPVPALALIIGVMLATTGDGATLPGCSSSSPMRGCRVGWDGGCSAGSAAWARWHADSDRRLRGLLQGLLVGARGLVSYDGQAHHGAFPKCTACIMRRLG